MTAGRLLLGLRFGIIFLLSYARCDQTGLVEGTEGGGATLQLIGVSAADIANITWIRDHNHILTTEPGKVTSLRDPGYEGRVSATRDGSLTIDPLTLTDQGNYTASVLLHNGDSHTIDYNLQVKEKDSRVRLALAVTLPLICAALLVIAVIVWRDKIKMDSCPAWCRHKQQNGGVAPR